MGFIVEPARFVEDAEYERSLESLNAYYSRFVGRHFDSLVLELDPARFTERDFFAVSTLSVNVPPEAGLALLDNAECESLLGEIPVDARIEDDSVSIEASSPAYLLWNLLRRLPGLGPTITSKLMAAKRPHLVPIHDSFVSDALLRGQLDGEWAAWRHAMASQDLRSTCERLRNDSEAPVFVPNLRILDVVVWMRVHGDVRAGDTSFWADPQGV